MYKLFLVFFVLYLFYTGVKSAILLRKGGQLIANTNYPATYEVGDSGSKLIYLVLGDSTAVGVGVSQLEKTYHYQVAQKIVDKGNKVSVVNIAKSGATVADVVKDQLPKIAEIKPNVISLSIGGNDATHMTNSATFESDMKTIIEAINSSGAKTILFGSTPNMFAIPALPRWFSWVAGRRSIVQNKITKPLLPSNFKYVDIFNDARLQGLPEYAPDWFHPNNKGYDRWARAFTKALE